MRMRVSKAFRLIDARWGSGFIEVPLMLHAAAVTSIEAAAERVQAVHVHAQELPGSRGRTFRSRSGPRQIFYIISGTVKVTIVDNVMTLVTGSTFFVPPSL